MHFTPETRIERLPEHPSARTSEREIAVMSVEQGAYYGLNEVATRIWELIEAPVTFEHLCAALQAEYDVTAEQCEQEVAGCLEQLIAEGLARVVAA